MAATKRNGTGLKQLSSGRRPLALETQGLAERRFVAGKTAVGLAFLVPRQRSKNWCLVPYAERLNKESAEDFHEVFPSNYRAGFWCVW